MDLLVTTEWLAKEIGASDLRIVEANAFMTADRLPLKEFEEGHIPGAIFMDMGDLIDTTSEFPNTVPPTEKFASRMQSMGLGDGSRIVVYDNSPLKTAARAHWLFTLFGAHDVAILDGGLAKWKAEGRALETGRPVLRHRHFTAWRDDSVFRSKGDMIANIESKHAQVLDARGPGRFSGEEPELREGMPSGHIPGSRNLPFGQLFNADDTWKSHDELKAIFHNAGIDITKPIITTCGSGVTAAPLLFAARLLGNKHVALYDGSWSEWAVDPSTPKEQGSV
jgi:thiosulfate/3-mercaptopyruvate sulfurtransferase